MQPYRNRKQRSNELPWLLDKTQRSVRRRLPLVLELQGRQARKKASRFHQETPSKKCETKTVQWLIRLQSARRWVQGGETFQRN